MEILGRLSGQRNGSEDISIMLFGKILLNFAIVFKVLILSYSEFSNHYWPTKLGNSCR